MPVLAICSVVFQDEYTVSVYNINFSDKQYNNINRDTIIDEPCSAFCTPTAQSDGGYRLNDTRFDFGQG